MKMTYQFKKDLMKTLRDAFHYKMLMHEMHGRMVYGAGAEDDPTAEDDYADSVNAYMETLEKFVRMLTWALLMSGDEEQEVMFKVCEEPPAAESEVAE